MDIIEAGFAIASRGRFRGGERSRHASARRPPSPSLARAAAADIDRAWRSRAPCGQARIHTFIATSPLHMRVRSSNKAAGRGAGGKRSASTVAHARNLCPDVEWSAERCDADRRPAYFWPAAIEIAIASGARTINLPDTVGYATPEAYGAMFRDVSRQSAPRRSGPSFLRTTHDDLVSPSPIRRLGGDGGRAAGGMRRSTASASAPATPRSRRSRWR